MLRQRIKSKARTSESVQSHHHHLNQLQNRPRRQQKYQLQHHQSPRLQSAFSADFNDVTH